MAEKTRNFRRPDWPDRCTSRRVRCVVLVLGLALLAPLEAAAVTLDQVVAMSKSGISDAVILAVIERDNTLFSIPPDQLVRLQREGLSDKLLLAMLKSGRQEPEPAMIAPARVDPAAAPIVPGPTVMIVGHGPEFPNTVRADEIPFVDLPPVVPPPVVFPVPYLPYLLPQAGHHGSRHGQRNLERTANPLLCVERIATGSSPFSPALTRVAECPPQMQHFRAR